MNGLRVINRILSIAVLGRLISERLVVIGVATLFSTHAAGSAELKVLSANAMRAALQELVREFEATSVHKVVIEYSTVGQVEEKVVANDPVDVAIICRLNCRARTSCIGPVSCRPADTRPRQRR